ncbi:MAG: 3-hydroxyacyl-CoA dehydrogenase family protein [Opitutus sp.]
MGIERVTIIGAGTMGANIALAFSAYGIAVRLNDVSETRLAAAIATARGSAAVLLQNELVTGSVDEIASRIASEPTLGAALDGAQLVLECIPENLPLKVALFAALDRDCAPEVILASNTSSFMPSVLAASLSPDRAARFLNIHFWNPAHLLPLVEIVPTARVHVEVLADVKKLLERCAKKAVVLQKEVPGFIGNRLAFALQREAMDLVAKGVASPADIDAVIRAGFGRRIPVSGIFGTADLGGLDVYLAICESIFPDLCAQTQAPAVLQSLVARGRLGLKSGAGWYDYSEKEIVALREAIATELVHHAHRDRQSATLPNASRHSTDPTGGPHPLTT